MKQQTGFLGTYFERDSVLRLELFVRFAAWGALAFSILEAGYSLFQNISGAVSGGYPLDWYSVLMTVSQTWQGFVIFILMQVAAKALLILLDIEDNTRRATRANFPKN
jgi:hypothetical protein